MRYFLNDALQKCSSLKSFIRLWLLDGPGHRWREKARDKLYLSYYMQHLAFALKIGKSCSWTKKGPDSLLLQLNPTNKKNVIMWPLLSLKLFRLQKSYLNVKFALSFSSFLKDWCLISYFSKSDHLSATWLSHKSEYTNFAVEGKLQGSKFEIQIQSKERKKERTEKIIKKKEKKKKERKKERKRIIKGKWR